MSYDIIYAITAHEEPLTVLDMIHNIQYYHPHTTVCIIVNATPPIYESILPFITSSVHVICAPSIRRCVSFDILDGYLQAFEYCHANGIVGKYFIPMASNCMFWKDITIEYIDSLVGKPTGHIITKDMHHSGWWWPKIYANHSIVSILNDNGIRNLISKQHEGSVIEYDIMKKIVDFIRENDLRNKVQQQVVFEEFLLSSLYVYFTGTDIAVACKIFWETHNYAPNMKDILSCDLPCVKRVLRPFNDPVRVWLRERADDYKRA